MEKKGLFQCGNEALFCREVVFETADEIGVGAIGTVFRLTFGLLEQRHALWIVVPKESGVMDKAIFANVLGVSTTFVGPDAVVIFLQCDRVGEERGSPAHDPFGKGALAVGNDGEEDGLFVDDDCATSTIALDQRDVEFVEVDQFIGFA